MAYEETDQGEVHERLNHHVFGPDQFSDDPVPDSERPTLDLVPIGDDEHDQGGDSHSHPADRAEAGDPGGGHLRARDRRRNTDRGERGTDDHRGGGELGSVLADESEERGKDRYDVVAEEFDKVLLHRILESGELRPGIVAQVVA